MRSIRGSSSAADNIAAHTSTGHVADMASPNNHHAPTPDASAVKNQLRNKILKGAAGVGGLGASAGAVKFAYDVGLNHPRTANAIDASTTHNQSQSQPRIVANQPGVEAKQELYSHKPWATDSNGYVTKTKLTPSQYNQYLSNKYGVDKANEAIALASGPGWNSRNLK